MENGGIIYLVIELMGAKGMVLRAWVHEQVA